VAVVCAFALSGCGGGGESVDAGGFTADERDAAQQALDHLRQTRLPGRVVAISYQSGEAPATCIVLPEPDRDGVFRLLLAWEPSRPAYRTLPRTLIEATIAAKGPVPFHVSTYSSRLPEPPSVKATLVRAALANPSEDCEVLESGRLRLVAPG
jgi:hypothetical protein